MGLRDLILQAKDQALAEQDVPEWGCTVWLKTWSGADRHKALHACQQAQSDEQVFAKVLVFSLVDEGGKPVFTEADVEQLTEKSGAVLDRLLKAALHHNGIGQETDAKNS